jgi:hypothetical protein
MSLDTYTHTVTETLARPLCAAMPDEHAWAAQPDPIDLQCEREAAALEWLQAELGIDTGATLFEKRRLVPIKLDCRYPKAATQRFFDRVQRYHDARLQGKPATMPVSKWELCRPADRARRNLRRERRKLLLAALMRVRDEWVDLATAQRLVDAKERTLFTAMITGRLRKRHVNHRTQVAVADLRTYLQMKLRNAA